jgi:hypothetical protein
MKPAIACLRNAISRQYGWRGFSMVLAFALMFVGWPQIDLHAHGKGDKAHVHALDHDADDHQFPEDPGAPGVMHVHDASSGFAWALPSRPSQIAAMPLAAWIPALTSAAGPLPARPPPQRPPIA